MTNGTGDGGTDGSERIERDGGTDGVGGATGVGTNGSTNGG